MIGGGEAVTSTLMWHGDAGVHFRKNDEAVSVTGITSQRIPAKRTATAGFCSRPNSMAAPLSCS
jgi:hypothetical protein